ncbi:MAG: hypothetical protein KDD72_14975 [Anaerolineales bacterium]|nr:hypothetical protein [Anaerolineales bacterium]
MGKKKEKLAFRRLFYLTLFIVGVALLIRVLTRQNTLIEYKNTSICDDFLTCRVMFDGAVVDYENRFSPTYIFRRYGTQQQGGFNRYFVEIEYLDRIEKIEVFTDTVVFIGRTEIEIWNDMPTKIEKIGVTNLNPEIESQFAIRDLTYFLVLSVLLSLLAHYLRWI